MKLKHNKTYIDNIGSRVKIKNVDDLLFRGCNGKMYYSDGIAVSGSFAFDLIEETHGTIKHFIKAIVVELIKAY